MRVTGSLMGLHILSHTRQRFFTLPTVDEAFEPPPGNEVRSMTVVMTPPWTFEHFHAQPRGKRPLAKAVEVAPWRDAAVRGFTY
jgi:hypothetical protein